MATNGVGIRDDPGRQLAELRPGDHLCMLYDSDSERLGALVPYLRDGLARGEACLYAVGDQVPEPVSTP